MNPTRLTPYAELAALLGTLPLITRETRRARRLSIETAAEQIGVSVSTLKRLEQGEPPKLYTTMAVMRWLDQTPEEET